MSILPFLAARDASGKPVTWSGPLAAVALGNPLTVDAWVAYRATGAVPEGLPEGLPVVTLRPIGAGLEAQSCELDAGPPEGYGAQLLHWLQASVPVDAPDRHLVVAKLIDARPEEERVAMQRHQQRERRLVWARLARALVAVDGEPLVDVGVGGVPRMVPPIEALELLPDLPLRCALAELDDHLNRISVLSPEGKARAGRA